MSKTADLLKFVSFGFQVVGVVNITTLSNRQYCVILDPVDKDGKPQLGRKRLVKGEKSFFLMPGERLEKGIQNVYVLGEDEGLILRAIESFTDTVSSYICVCVSVCLSACLCVCLSVCLSWFAGALAFPHQRS